MDNGESFRSEMYKVKFCDVCKKDLKMRVVQDNTGDNFIWCNCPECKGIAPYSRTKGKNANSHKKTAGNNEQENYTAG
jgi:ssDNA-binding Zn-finger/Zn-ribbon topoisomerase 1